MSAPFLRKRLFFCRLSYLSPATYANTCPTNGQTLKRYRVQQYCLIKQYQVDINDLPFDYFRSTETASYILLWSRRELGQGRFSFLTGSSLDNPETYFGNNRCGSKRIAPQVLPKDQFVRLKLDGAYTTSTPPSSRILTCIKHQPLRRAPQASAEGTTDDM